MTTLKERARDLVGEADDRLGGHGFEVIVPEERHHDFLNDASLWAERLPHVATVAVTD